MRGKLLSLLAIVSALAIVVSSCTDDLPTSPLADRLSAAAVCRSDPFGCIGVDRGKPIRLAALVPTGYPSSQYGFASVPRSVKMAIGDRRRILGRDVVLTRRSDGCGHYSPLTNLASDPTIAAVIGAGCSSTHELAKEVFSENGVIFVSATSSGPALTTATDYRSFFLRTMHNDRVQGTAMAAFVGSRLASRTATTVYDGSPFAKSLVSDFTAGFVEGGGTILDRRSIRVGTIDFRKLLARIRRASPDFVYAPLFVAEAAELTQQLRVTEGTQEIVLGGAEGIFTPDWLEAAGSAAEGVYLSAPDYRFLDPRFDREFVPQFHQRFGTFENLWPGFLSRAYDATNMILDAIEDVAFEEDGTLFISRTALRDRMFATKDHPGLSGTLTCDSNGDCNHSTPVVIYQVRNGEFRKAWTWDPTA